RAVRVTLTRSAAWAGAGRTERCFVLPCTHASALAPHLSSTLPEMPTVGERLATIEASLAEIRNDVRKLRNGIEGGNGVTWERSVRGRLHYIENNIAAT